MHDPNITISFTSQDALSTSLQSLLPYLLSVILLLLPLTTFLRSASPTPLGCRRLGTPNSNITDEYDPQYSQGVASDSIDARTGLPAWRIKALFTYPIKSCTGVELDTAEVIDTGLKYDRLFCFAEYIESKPALQDSSSPESGHWIARTLRDRHFSRLALLRPEIWIPDPSQADYSSSLPEVQSQGVLVIHYPRTLAGCMARIPLMSSFVNLAITLGLLSREQSFRIPLCPPTLSQKEDEKGEGAGGAKYPLRPVKIWKDNPLAYDYGHHLPASLRRFLAAAADDNTAKQKPLTLFRECAAHHRQIFRNAPSKETLGFQTVTGFQDAYPLHMLNLASVHDVARRCQAEIPRLTVRRFRANVIVQGPGCFEEDAWRRIRVGGGGRGGTGLKAGAGRVDKEGESEGVEIHLACRTIRCRLPNVDPDTGVRHRSEPDRTMKSYRRIDRGDPTNACLGMQLVPAVRNFTLRVNDPITVLETGEHCYIKMLAPGEVVEGV
ncbi:MOSC domain protein [Aspergillus saccharolyticus JOP 1030-1]|uniref:MOSC domain-containing protein n=1 Tax=Aspergillus saccharolyticus JOP 1030-1 TaxID=1450539 RepID=A0A319AB56_9EURO|nr:hypothetical protein BP01DRAFT_332981 [Aspergillus saccharolyticus JOP 1030-1]PYH48878.1 hypothetical protein BP01DRAFT_332981 [Aspergillus saccharolyticus JOP 1030-1]